MRKEFNQDYYPDARFLYTADLIQMQNGGCPFEANDLSEDEWKWIGWFKRAGEKFSYDKMKK